MTGAAGQSLASGEPAPGTGDWSIVPSPNTSATQNNQLYDVTCLSASDCWAVGYFQSTSAAGQTLIEHWNGTVWTIVPSPNTSAAQINFLFGVTCASASDCWAVGRYFTGSKYQTLIEHWNGMEWTIVPSPNTSAAEDNLLWRVTCVSASDCWAVGYYFSAITTTAQTLVEHWNGTVWTIVPSPNMTVIGTNREISNVVYSVACVSASDCWVIGYYYPQSCGCAAQTLILRWDGISWTIVPSPNTSPDENNHLFDVTCLSASDCWAVGWAWDGAVNQTLIERWDGTLWTIVPSPNTLPAQGNWLEAVTCVSASVCWAVGRYHNGIVPQTLIERWDGSSWEIVTSPNTSAEQESRLFGVTCAPASDCWAVGRYYTDTDTAQTLTVKYTVTHTPTPQVIDIGGDANGINSQGNGADLDVDTAPASIDSADLLEVRLETTYEVVKDLDDEGNVVFVRHVATGLRMKVKTTAPAKPTFGPTTTFRTPATVGTSCQVHFYFYVKGTQQGALDIERAGIDRLAGCSGDITTGFTLEFDGNVSVVTFPFDKTMGLLANGTKLGANTKPSSRVAFGSGTQEVLTAPVIDETRLLSDFVIGSDVPADIDCTEAPDNPECRT